MWLNERTDVSVLSFHSYIRSFTGSHFHRNCREKSVTPLVVPFLLCHLVNLGSDIFYPNLNVVCFLPLHCTRKYRGTFFHISHFSFLPNQRKESHCWVWPEVLRNELLCFVSLHDTVSMNSPLGCNSIEYVTSVCLLGWYFCCNSPSLGVSFGWTEIWQ